MSMAPPRRSGASSTPPAAVTGASPHWKYAFFALVGLYLVVTGVSLSSARLGVPLGRASRGNIAAIAVPRQQEPARMVLEEQALTIAPAVSRKQEPGANLEQEEEELPSLAPFERHEEEAPALENEHPDAVAQADAAANAIAGDAEIAALVGKDGSPQSLLSLVEAMKFVKPTKVETSPALRTFTMMNKLQNEHRDEAMKLLRNPADRSDWHQTEFEAEVARLREMEANARDQVARLQTVIDATNRLVSEESVELEEIAARNAIDLRHYQPRKIRRNLECLGWKQTGGCSPYGKREPDQDKKCAQLVSGGVSGYCELLDRDTGEHFRVMQLNCSSVRTHVTFSCAQAADFANFGVQTEDILEKTLNTPHSQLLGSTGSGDGIVMVVYPKLMTSAYASISVLRKNYGCELPIELWVSEAELIRTPTMKDSLALLEQQFTGVKVQKIKDPSVFGFNTKIHAVYHSSFENVLFLDADNVPVRDPTYLFSSPEFTESGAVFWPDFWHPRKTIFNIHSESLLWELVDMDFVDMFEQESGQLLIDRRRAAVALEVLMFYQYHRPNHFDKLVLAHGDKDLFRLAWLKTQTPFFMMPYPPGAAGSVRKDKFCGMTMVQYDAEGRVLFLHRNARKLLGKVDHMDGKYWEYLQSFDWRRGNGSAVMNYDEITAEGKYVIGIQGSAPLFKEFESCYGAEPEGMQHFNLTRFQDLPFKDLEEHLVNYAHEAALLAQEATTERKQ
jgi:alpha 1,2-mannosyltransferase